MIRIRCANIGTKVCGAVFIPWKMILYGFCVFIILLSERRLILIVEVGAETLT